jgi:hypothetical protein
VGIFKSREERSMERSMEIKRGISKIKRNIGKLAKHEEEWLRKARRARKIDDTQQFGFMRAQLKRTAAQRRLRERQLLSLETALQIKNQAEADVEFATSMASMSKAVADLYGSVDMAKTQVQFEKAMAQAESMKERMDMFLDVINESFTAETEEEDLIDDKEIDAMLEEEVVHEEKSGGDKDIEKELKDLEDELGK